MDAYRGFVMFLMMAEVLHVGRVAEAYPDSAFWKFLDFHTSHVEWVGCSLHDMIQPSFSFLVGVALPFSIASRAAKGQSAVAMTGHALWRSLILILLGVFLRSVGRPQTNWTFEDTLTQIGLGYPFLFALGLTKPRVQFGALVVVLFGYWLAWALYPVAGPDFDYAKVGVPPDWAHHASGFAAHWNKNGNLGSAFDQWFLNLFPRAKEFVANGGGYLTLSFVPTLATMLLGLLAGGWLKSDLPHKTKLKRLLLASAACLALGTALHLLGVCPIVKRIWTPTWALFSGGLCFLFMAGFYAVVDARGWKGWSFPLVVIGMNSIAAYCIAHLWDGFIASSFKTHLGPNAFKLFGDTFAPMLQGSAVLLALWLILFWMYRKKLFLRI
ncbi:MAG: hypothetical protein IPK15_07185 [Verrucomicrobia bacterium]|nr:hypothetical protein [Verrucomicrobiota bacterium]